VLQGDRHRRWPLAAGELANSIQAPPYCAILWRISSIELTSSPYPAHLWSAGQCMENCGCTGDKCFCVDKDQKPWPLVGTEFEKQLKKGHIANSGKKGMCACSCDKEGL
jgi:hypothetical protein